MSNRATGIARILCLALVTTFILQSCSSSKNALDASKDPSVFVAPGYVKKPYQKLIFLARADDAAKEKLVEDALVKEFKSKGRENIAAYSVVTPELLKDTAALRSKLETSGFDGAVVVTWLGKVGKTVDQFQYSGTMYSVFYGAMGVFDLDTRTVNTGYAQVDFFIAGTRGTQYRSAIPLTMSGNRDATIEQLAIGCRKRLELDIIK